MAGALSESELVAGAVPVSTWCGGPPSPLCRCEGCRQWVRANPDEQTVRDHRRRVEAWMAAHPGVDPETGRELIVTAETYLAGVYG